MNRQFDNLTSGFYQLSHATMRDFYEVTSRYYQLSHATIYVIRFLGLAVRVTSTGTHRIG